MGGGLGGPLTQATGRTSPCGFLVVKSREALRGYPKGPRRGFPIANSTSPQVREGKFSLKSTLARWNNARDVGANGKHTMKKRKQRRQREKITTRVFYHAVTAKPSKVEPFVA